MNLSTQAIRLYSDPLDQTPSILKHSTTPGFGETWDRKAHYSMSWQETAVTIASQILPVFMNIGYGFSSGIISSAAILATHTIIKAISEFLPGKHPCMFQRTLTAEHLVPNTATSARLGKYEKADVRISDVADDSFQWKIELIKSAEESIELTPNFAGGIYFQQILDAIDARMSEKPQLRTHLLIREDYLENEDILRLESLQKKYQERFCWLSNSRIYHLVPTIHSEENHVKLLIVDGRYFIIGGTGIHEQLSREESTPDQKITGTVFGTMLLQKGSRDVDTIAKSDKIGALLRNEFFKLYQIWETRWKNSPTQSRFFPIKSEVNSFCYKFEDEQDGKLIRQVSTKILVSGPEHGENRNPITLEYIKRIEKAKQKIQIANFILDPIPSIYMALKQARKKKSLQIIGYTSGDKYLPIRLKIPTTMRARGNYTYFDKVHEYDVESQWYHKKTALFDNTHFICGSYNLGKKSCANDHEIVVVIKDERIAELYKKTLQLDKKRSTAYTSSLIQANHFWNSLVSRVTSFLVEPFL